MFAFCFFVFFFEKKIDVCFCFCFFYLRYFTFSCFSKDFLGFLRFCTFGQVERNARYGRSRHRPTQVFEFVKLLLRPKKVAIKTRTGPTLVGAECGPVADNITVQPGPYHSHVAWHCEVSLRQSKSSRSRKIWTCSPNSVSCNHRVPKRTRQNQQLHECPTAPPNGGRYRTLVLSHTACSSSKVKLHKQRIMLALPLGCGLPCQSRLTLSLAES